MLKSSVVDFFLHALLLICFQGGAVVRVFFWGGGVCEGGQINNDHNEYHTNVPAAPGGESNRNDEDHQGADRGKHGVKVFLPDAERVGDRAKDVVDKPFVARVRRDRLIVGLWERNNRRTQTT